MDTSWLQEKLTITEIEADNRIYAPHLKQYVPFGQMNSHWVGMKKYILATDQMWTFRSPQITWQHSAGRAGYAVVRNGKIVAHMVTMKT